MREHQVPGQGVFHLCVPVARGQVCEGLPFTAKEQCGGLPLVAKDDGMLAEPFPEFKRLLFRDPDNEQGLFGFPIVVAGDTPGVKRGKALAGFG